jgi:Holliday junction DNA helicase RuvB
MSSRELLNAKVDLNEDDSARLDGSLRPKDFDEYVGQEKVTSNLKLYIEAARQRGDALDHCLFAGPPGLGKTTLAQIVSRKMGGQLYSVAAPLLEKKGDLAAVLTALQPHDVLFIDEIHRLHGAIEEVLYGAMEDFKLDIIIGQGPGAKTLKIDLPPFTLIGATTRTGSLTGPLRDRFGVQFRLEFYNAEQLKQIVSRSAGILGVPIDVDGALEIARRSRGTPRIANRLLRRVRDYAQVHGGGRISYNVAAAGLELLDVDSSGLDAMDRRLLETIVDKFDGGPVGIETLSAAMGEERATLEEVYEPYLMQEGFIQRTPRGRVATRKSFQFLGKNLPLDHGGQQELLP